MYHYSACTFYRVCHYRMYFFLPLENHSHAPPTRRPCAARTGYTTTIPPLYHPPRNVPQIEVTFDIDADGILSVQAVELSSGQQARITITHDKMNLSNNDIERMVHEAQTSHAADTAAKCVTAA